MSCEARKSIQGQLTTLELVLTFEEGKSEFIKGVTCEYGDVPGHTKMSVLTPFLFGGRRGAGAEENGKHKVEYSIHSSTTYMSVKAQLNLL